MAKVSGLQLIKPRFDWDYREKVTEIEQFKADSKIIFDVPLSELKDKQCAGLIVNWLGREATQIPQWRLILAPQMMFLKHWKRYLDQSQTIL